MKIDHWRHLKLAPLLFLAGLMAVTAAFDVAYGEERAPEVVTIANVPSGKYKFDLDHSHLYWAVSHAGYSMTRGRFNRFDGSLVLDNEDTEKSVLEVRIELDSVDTNIAALDADLKSDRVFNVEKHPEAVFVFEGVELFSKTTGKVTGMLTLNGVTKPVVLDVKLNDTTERPREPRFTRMGFSASAKINRLEWGIDLFPDVIGHQVTLTIDVEFLLDV